MSESARDPYVGINQHISQRANKEQHPTYTIGRILSLDPIKIRADGIDLEKEDLRVAESMYPNFLADVEAREENGIETLLPENWCRSRRAPSVRLFFSGRRSTFSAGSCSTSTTRCCSCARMTARPIISSRGW